MHIGRFVNRGSTIDGRPRAGSYVEVFTNGQIDVVNFAHPSYSVAFQYDKWFKDSEQFLDIS